MASSETKKTAANGFHSHPKSVAWEECRYIMLKTERRIFISPTLFRILGQKFAMENYIPRSCVILMSSFKGSKVVSRSGSTYAEDVLDDQADDVNYPNKLVFPNNITDNNGWLPLIKREQMPWQPSNKHRCDTLMASTHTKGVDSTSMFLKHSKYMSWRVACFVRSSLDPCSEWTGI